jgi:FtsH-binding integral membrane protein
MNDFATPSQALPTQVGLGERGAFLVRTYNHLFGAVVGFALIEILLFKSGWAERIALALQGVSWLLVLGGFVLVSWIASRAAHQARSLAVQYLALSGFVVAEALIFVPLLYLAERVAPGAIESAAALTLIGFAGLTGIVFWTRKDFSFLGGLLRWGGVLALLVIVAAVLFGLQLGSWFSIAMVGLAGASILYDTSNVLRRFPEDRYVAAALELFASVALMFWYVLRLFLSRD